MFSFAFVLIVDKVKENVESDECLVCKRIALNFENFLKFNDVSMDNQLNSLCQEFSEEETSLVSTTKFLTTLR